MADPNFGVVFQLADDEPRPTIWADLDVIGIVGPSPGHNTDRYGLNWPYLISSKDTSAIEALGPLGNGSYIRDAIQGINDQLADMDQAATLIVVLTEYTQVLQDPAANLQRRIRRIVGDSTQGTGMWALTRAASIHGVTPRIVLVPGYTSQMANQLYSISLTHSGLGYDALNPPAVAFSGGGSSPEIQQAEGYAIVDHGVSGGFGRITKIVLTKPGLWYTTPPTITIDPPPGGVSGVGETPRRFQAVAAGILRAMANPVCAELPAVLSQLIGHAVVESAGSTETLDKRWRSTLNSQRLIGISGGVMTTDPKTGVSVVMPQAPRVAGLILRRDQETGAPFNTAANQPMYGIIGPARDMKFSITDGDNQGQRLLAANMGILVRGSVGNDFAIADGGFVSITTDNLGDDELWRFYNVTRGRDFIHLSLLKTLRFYLGKYNITGQTVQAVLNSMNLFLRDLKARNYILGYNVGFQGSLNSASEIRLGHITVSFQAEEPSPLKKITVISARYSVAIDQMVADIERQLNNAAPV